MNILVSKRWYNSKIEETSFTLQYETMFWKMKKKPTIPYFWKKYSGPLKRVSKSIDSNTVGQRVLSQIELFWILNHCVWLNCASSIFKEEEKNLSYKRFFPANYEIFFSYREFVCWGKIIFMICQNNLENCLYYYIPKFAWSS